MSILEVGNMGWRHKVWVRNLGSIQIRVYRQNGLLALSKSDWSRLPSAPPRTQGPRATPGFEDGSVVTGVQREHRLWKDYHDTDFVEAPESKTAIAGMG